MVYFQTKNHSWDKLGRVLQWKMLVCFIVICFILRPFGIFYGHLVYIFPVLVCCTIKNLATLVSGSGNGRTLGLLRPPSLGIDAKKRPLPENRK
jgi:hypothetical protein